MVTTSDSALWRAIWSFKDHGKSYEAVYEREHPPGFRWLHEAFGTNWRMMEMQAVIGRIQLRRMPQWTAQRNAAAATILGAISRSPAVRVPEFRCGAACGRGCSGNSGCVHACYKAYGYLRPERLSPGWNRDRVIAAINSRGVPCYQGSCPEVYLEKAFEGTGWRPAERLPVARELGETSLMFLVHPGLSEAEIARTVTVAGGVLAEAAG